MQRNHEGAAHKEVKGVNAWKPDPEYLILALQEDWTALYIDEMTVEISHI